VLQSLTRLPALGGALWIVYLALGEVQLLDSTSGGDLAWRLVAFSALFTALYRWLDPVLAVALHPALVLAWKWGAVGRLSPGRDLTASRWLLLRYAVLRRLLDAPSWSSAQTVLAGTPLWAALHRALGAKVGAGVCLGGLVCVEFDALDVGDCACSGSLAHAYATDDDGVIRAITLEREATVGNSALLYPGVRVGERAVVGNDTALCAGRAVGADTRVQGGIEYNVGPKGGDLDPELGLPQVVSASAGGAQRARLPWWHAPALILLMLAVSPVAPCVLWMPLAVGATLLKGFGWWIIPLAYILLVAVGSAFAVAWLRALVEASGIRGMWASGSASMFDLRAQLIDAQFVTAGARLDVFNGTPFAVWIYRALGFQVGRGAVMLGEHRQEVPLISVGADSVLEAGSRLDGHYLEFLRFIYNPVRVGRGCWVQDGARVMPSTVMEDGSRVLPASMVLPGDTLAARMVWGGLPAEPVMERPDPDDGRAAGSRRRLTRCMRLTSIPRKGGGKNTGMSGMLGSIASTKQRAAHTAL
jgi:acetyltransferase-like isoleucine patch superfamily enzyme